MWPIRTNLGILKDVVTIHVGVFSPFCSICLAAKIILFFVSRGEEDAINMSLMFFLEYMTKDVSIW